MSQFIKFCEINILKITSNINKHENYLLKTCYTYKL